jgi:signal transduction histidine kinase
LSYAELFPQTVSAPAGVSVPDLLGCLDAISDYAIVFVDHRGVILSANATAAALLGPAPLTGLPLATFVTVVLGAGETETRLWVSGCGGDQHWASLKVRPWESADGRARGYGIFIRDLSGAAAEPGTEQDVLLLDPCGVIKSWNAGPFRQKSSRGPELVGKHFSLFYTPQEVREGTPLLHLELAAKKEEVLEDAGWRFTLEGDRYWAKFRLTALRDRDGELTGYSLIIRDKTDKKTISDLEDSLRMRDEFLSVASHELRTPVTKLLLNLQLVKRTGEGLTDRILKSLDVCEQSTKELIGLMDNLVDVTRLRLGKLELRRTKTNITTVVLNVLTKYKDQVRLGGHHVSFHHEGEMVGYWDQTRLEQLLSNLFSNALKYAAGSPIRLELKNLGDRILFTIADAGPGIPHHLQAKVFERFERAADSRKISGLGLGLYVSRQIVVAHRGEITLESAPGEGAKFSVTLPLKKA